MACFSQGAMAAMAAMKDISYLSVLICFVVKDGGKTADGMSKIPRHTAGDF